MKRPRQSNSLMDVRGILLNIRVKQFNLTNLQNFLGPDLTKWTQLKVLLELKTAPCQSGCWHIKHAASSCTASLLTRGIIAVFAYSAVWLMLRALRWFVCIWKHTFPLIYRCMGLCNEYSTLQFAPPHPNDWLSMRSPTSHRCSPPSGHSCHRWSNLAGAFFAWRSSRSVSTDVLVTTPHATSTFLAPPLCA